MSDFLKFFDDMVQRFPMHLNITYNKTTDWCIDIWKKGCAEDYPEAEHDGDDVVIVAEQDDDMELCFAKAHVALKNWLCDYNGGY